MPAMSLQKCKAEVVSSACDAMVIVDPGAYYFLHSDFRDSEIIKGARRSVLLVDSLDDIEYATA